MDERLIVALDACVLIEAVLHENTSFPSARILALARTHSFRVLLAPQAEGEARRQLQARGLEPALYQLLAACDVERCAEPTPAEMQAFKPAIWAQVRDEPDAEIGVAIRCANPKPHLFVSSNRSDWKPSPQVDAALDGVHVMRTRDFARLILPD